MRGRTRSTVASAGSSLPYSASRRSTHQWWPPGRLSWQKGGRMNKVLIILAAVTLLAAGPSLAANLNCKAGPVLKTFGGTQWNVYGCDDNASVVIITAPGNP